MKKIIVFLISFQILLFSNYENEKTIYEKENIEKLKKNEIKKYEEKRNRVLQYDKFEKEVTDYKIKDFDFESSYDYAKINDKDISKRNINEIANIQKKEQYDDLLKNNDIYGDLDYFKTYGFENVKEVFKSDNVNSFSFKCNIDEDFFISNSEELNKLKSCIQSNSKLNGEYYFYGDVNDIMDFLAINNINIEKEFLFLFISNENLQKTMNLLTYKNIRFLTINNYTVNSAMMVFPNGFITEGKFYLKEKHKKEYTQIVKELQNLQKNSL